MRPAWMLKCETRAMQAMAQRIYAAIQSGGFGSYSGNFLDGLREGSGDLIA